jgi:hypothetical protein
VHLHPSGWSCDYELKNRCAIRQKRKSPPTPNFIAGIAKIINSWNDMRETVSGRGRSDERNMNRIDSHFLARPPQATWPREFLLSLIEFVVSQQTAYLSLTIKDSIDAVVGATFSTLRNTVPSKLCRSIGDAINRTSSSFRLPDRFDILTDKPREPCHQFHRRADIVIRMERM